MGHSFGGFALIQLTKILAQGGAIFETVLINSSCRDFMNLRNPKRQSLKYAHAVAVGKAYQMLQVAKSNVEGLCAVKTSKPIFVFKSDNDTVVPKVQSARVAMESNSELLVLKNEGHSIGQRSSRLVVETVLGNKGQKNISSRSSK